MRNHPGRLLVLILVLFATWISFEIELLVFGFTAAWVVFINLFQGGRNRAIAIPLVLASLFAIGVPFLVAAGSGLALFHVERPHSRKFLDEAFLKRVALITCAIVLFGGLMVMAGRAQNVPLQFWGGIVMLFGTVSLFTFAWASVFARRGAGA